MNPTKAQSDRLRHLEDATEAGISGVSLKVYLPRLADESIWKLAEWAEVSADRAPALADWLHRVAVEEIYRRANKRPIEVKSPRLPVTWTDSELADAIEVSWGIAASNLSKELDVFLVELNKHLAVAVASRLRKTEQ